MTEIQTKRNKKSDKAKKNFDLHGKNTARGLRIKEKTSKK